MEKIGVQFSWLDPQASSDLKQPGYESELASGMDLAAAVLEPVTILPGEIQLIPTGFAVALPPGFELQVRPRSGLAVKHGVTVINSPGTIDADYRGEVKVGLINHGKQPFTVERGDRIAQMILAPVYQALLEEADNLEETKRGSGGFGHTGIKA